VQELPERLVQLDPPHVGAFSRWERVQDLAGGYPPALGSRGVHQPLFNHVINEAGERLSGVVGLGCHWASSWERLKCTAFTSQIKVEWPTFANQTPGGNGVDYCG
jgi:hypothetical protein